MNPQLLMMASGVLGQAARPATAPGNIMPEARGQLDGSNWTVNYGQYTQPESTTRVLIIGAVLLAAVLIWKKGR